MLTLSSLQSIKYSSALKANNLNPVSITLYYGMNNSITLYIFLTLSKIFNKTKRFNEPNPVSRMVSEFGPPQMLFVMLSPGHMMLHVV